MKQNADSQGDPHNMTLLPFQRAWSVTVALLSLTACVWLGVVIPRVKTGILAIGAEGSHAIVLWFHWSWGIPMGVVIATGLIAKDFWFRPVVAGRINLIVLWAAIVTWGACVSLVCLRFVPYG
jgi:hypothetical protein